MEVPSPPPSCRRRGASCPSRRPRRPSGREASTRAGAPTARAADQEGRRHPSARGLPHRVPRPHQRWTGAAAGARPGRPHRAAAEGARRPQSATAEEAHLRSRRGAAELPNQSLCEEVHPRNHPDGEEHHLRSRPGEHHQIRPFWDPHHQSRHRGARRRSRRGARRRRQNHRVWAHRRHRSRGAAGARRRRAARRRGASPTARRRPRAVRARLSQRPRPRPRVRLASARLPRGVSRSLRRGAPRPRDLCGNQLAS